MNQLSRTRTAVILAMIFTVYLPTAWADGCRTEDEKIAATQMRKADDLERAGKLKAAYEAMGTVDSMCLAGDGSTRHEAMKKRLGLQLGQQDEKQGRLATAFDWYRNSGNEADADRVKMKHVNTSLRDRHVVSNAIDHFRFRNNDARVTELRQLAAKNAELELTNEEKAFTARKTSFDELGNARDWLSLTDEALTKTVRERAERRGDTLLKEDAYRHLENAKRYFSMAEAKSKEKAVQDKALRLAQEHEKKGEITQASNFYSLAGATEKGNELEARTAAQHKKSEAARQKKFTKEQDDLEKELGL